MTPTDDTIPYGFCHCGCGQKTTIPVKSNAPQGVVKGEPQRFVHNHHRRLIQYAKPKPSVVIDDDPSRGWVRIRLTRGKVALIDRCDLALVAFQSWSAMKFNGSWYAQNSTAGGTLHRVLMGKPEGKLVDHVNGNPLDNRRKNLRLCDRSGNAQNRKRPRTNTTGFKGVQERRGRFFASVNSEGTIKRFGPFDTAEEAARSYDREAVARFGEFARTNFRS